MTGRQSHAGDGFLRWILLGCFVVAVACEDASPTAPTAPPEPPPPQAPQVSGVYTGWLTWSDLNADGDGFSNDDWWMRMEVNQAGSVLTITASITNDGETGVPASLTGNIGAAGVFTPSSGSGFFFDDVSISDSCRETTRLQRMTLTFSASAADYYESMTHACRDSGVTYTFTASGLLDR